MSKISLILKEYYLLIIGVLIKVKLYKELNNIGRYICSIIYYYGFSLNKEQR